MLTRAEAKNHPNDDADICLNKRDKAPRKQSKLSTADDADDDNDNDEGGLSIDEHYVCNIAMMRIAEEERELATSKTDARPGGNELEIDRQEEEQTISELVRASSTGALLEA